MEGEAPQARARLTAHLDRCPHCRALAVEANALDALLVAEEPRPDFVNRVMARIDALEAPAPARRPAWRPALASLSAAAVVVVAVAAWLVIGRAPSPVAPV